MTIAELRTPAHDGPQPEFRTDPSVTAPSRPRLNVTVVLCSYNGEAFLQQQLESLAAQTRLPDEVVIGDDNSADSTVDIIERFRASAPFPVRLVRRKVNLGTSANFTATAWGASSEIVFLCDQDDLWVEHKIERMVAEFERRPELLALHTNARLVDANGASLRTDLFKALEISPVEIDRVRSGRAFEAFIRRNLATGATMAVRRQLLGLALPTPPEWMHDEWLATIAAGLGSGTVDVIDEPLIDYRQHGNNQIGARQLTFSEKVARMFRDRGPFYRFQLRRSRVLLDKFAQLGPMISSESVELVQDRLRHVGFRASLPHHRLNRVAPILTEIVAGRYRRHSTVLGGVVRDILERA